MSQHLYRTTLPTSLTSFVGREREVAEIADLIQGRHVRLLTLLGPGGVGKTRLAIEASDQAGGAFADGVWFVDLAPLTDPALVLSAIARALGLQESGDDPLEQRLAQYLRERHALLVLDNVEQVVTAAPGVGVLVATCPDLVILATSRVPLAVAGEQEYPVHPLSARAADGTAGTPDAVRLFAERAHARDPGFALTPEITPVVAEICRRLDGLPLAIELAAARVKTLPPRDLLARLEYRLPLLTGGRQDVPRRQQTMRDAIAWSYDLLNPAEQALFRRLSVFVGGFTLDAAEAVAADPALDLLDGIASLLDKNLIRRTEPTGAAPRYGMLETIREYGLEQLGEHNELDPCRARHAAWLADFGSSIAEPLGPVPIEIIEQLAAEHDNARAALRWAIDARGAKLRCGSQRRSNESG